MQLDFVYYTSDDDSAIRKGTNLVSGKQCREVLEDYIREKKVVSPATNPRILLERQHSIYDRALFYLRGDWFIMALLIVFMRVQISF